MEYSSINIPSELSIKGIFTVISPILSSKRVGIGESHSFPEIFFLDKGEHRINLDGYEYPIHEGQMIIYAPNSYHASAVQSDSSASIISFDVESSSLYMIYNQIITLNENERRAFKDIFELASKCFNTNVAYGTVLREGVGEYELQRIKLKLEVFLTDLIISVKAGNRHSSARGETLDSDYASVVAFMRKNIANRLTLNEIAEGCLISVSKLKMLFRERSGIPPISYFIKLKIEEAKRLIRLEEMNISEISSALGFESIHYFSRLFKKTEGLSPSEYKKLCK